MSKGRKHQTKRRKILRFNISVRRRHPKGLIAEQKCSCDAATLYSDTACKATFTYRKPSTASCSAIVSLKQNNHNICLFGIRKRRTIMVFFLVSAAGTSAELCLQNNIYYTKLRRFFQNKNQTDAYTRNMRKL